MSLTEQIEINFIGKYLNFISPEAVSSKHLIKTPHIFFVKRPVFNAAPTSKDGNRVIACRERPTHRAMLSLV